MAATAAVLAGGGGHIMATAGRSALGVAEEGRA